LEAPHGGCALCGATWGDYWQVIEGKRLFFCCDVCGKQYATIIDEAKKRKGWKSVDALEMRGNYRGRVCTVSQGSESYRFLINFFENGDLRISQRIANPHVLPRG
jgi:hypothetical protein